MDEAIFFMMMFSIPLAVIFTRFYLRLQELKLKNGGDMGDNSELRKTVGNLIAENEDLKERMKNLEYIMSDDKRRIDLEYQKEQILIDKQKKF